MFKDKGSKAAPAFDPDDPRLSVLGTVILDGKTYVVTRYEPGVFTTFKDGRFVDAVEVREVLEVVRQPDEKVLAADDFLTVAKQPPTATPAKEKKQ